MPWLPGLMSKSDYTNPRTAYAAGVAIGTIVVPVLLLIVLLLR
jgi:hypothetical protein